MNSIMERWIGSCRRELLDRTLVWNQRHLMMVLREYEDFYNTHRPHRALSQAAPLRPLPDGVTDLDHFWVQRHDRQPGRLSRRLSRAAGRLRPRCGCGRSRTHPRSAQPPLRRRSALAHTLTTPRKKAQSFFSGTPLPFTGRRHGQGGCLASDDHMRQSHQARPNQPGA